MDVIIRMVEMEQVGAYVDHLHAHMSESGIKGNMVYTPYDRGYEHPKDKMLEAISARLALPLTELKWGRAFVAIVDDKIAGHLDLQGYHMPGSMHRCKLGIGLDRDYRGHGIGHKLMEAAIEWAREMTMLDWIDLYTFSHNLPAIALYDKVGFKKVGAVEDMFRVDGEKITDYQMVLKIERS